MTRPQSSGMLKGGRGILEHPCQDVNRSVPYFKELRQDEGRANDFVFDRFQELSEKNISLVLKDVSIDGLQAIPDGIISVTESN